MIIESREVLGLIQHNTATPLYQQIKNQIEIEIEEGRYTTGDKLPSEREMCEAYAVSRIPVRKALELLEAEGLIQSFQGKGSFVSAPKIQNNLVHIQTFAETLAQQGYSGYTRIVSYEERCSDPGFEMLLDASAGTSRLMLLGHANGEPVVFYDCHLKASISQRFYDAAKTAEAAGEAFSTFDLYSKTMTMIGKVDQRVLAVNADKQISSVLNIPEGTAVLVLETVIFNGRMEAVEYKRGYYRTDKYLFKLHRSL